MTDQQQIPQTSTKIDQKVAVIIDTNAIIKQLNLRLVINPSIQTDEEFAEKYELYTLKEVIGEVRDERARQFLANLPYEVQIEDSSFIDDADRITVENFAKDTGDFKTLSYVDILVIAFGLTLAREKGEIQHVLQEPKPLEEFRPKSFKEFYDAGFEVQGEDEKKEIVEEVAEEEDDGFTEVGKKNNKRNEIKEHHLSKVQE